MVARTAVFQTVVDQDLIFSETAGRNVLGVRHDAHRLAGRVALDRPLLRRVGEPDPGQRHVQRHHQAVAYVPGTVFRSDTALFAPLPWRARADCPVRASLGGGVTYVGPRPLPYGELSGDIFTVDGVG